MQNPRIQILRTGNAHICDAQKSKYLEFLFVLNCLSVMKVSTNLFDKSFILKGLQIRPFTRTLTWQKADDGFKKSVNNLLIVT